MNDAADAAKRAGQRSLERRPATAPQTATDTANVYLIARQMQAQAMADLTVRGLRAIGRGLGALTRGLVQRTRRARQRRRTLNELYKLDARALRDIGIDPRNVEAAVEQLLAQQHGDDRHDQRHAGLGDVVRHVDELMAPLRQWDLSRRAAGDMARMNRETLNDLGYGKGHVDTVPDELARRRVHANRNQHTDKAA
jgi:uncharacterized protein YjiS (DUF1127 family)